MTYFGLKFLLGSTPSCDFGRSRTCPIDALTMNFESRYFWIVFTFVGDSTTTSDFATARPPPPARRQRSTVGRRAGGPTRQLGGQRWIAVGARAGRSEEHTSELH